MDEKHGNGLGIVARLCGLYRRQKSSLKMTLQSKSSMRWLFATKKGTVPSIHGQPEVCRGDHTPSAEEYRFSNAICPNSAGEVTINRLIESINMREI